MIMYRDLVIKKPLNDESRALYSRVAKWCNGNNEYKIIDGGNCYEVVPTQIKQEPIKLPIDFIIGNLLNDLAKAKGYSTSTITSYVNSQVLQFKQEAEDYIYYRDCLWNIYFDNKDKSYNEVVELLKNVDKPWEV